MTTTWRSAPASRGARNQVISHSLGFLGRSIGAQHQATFRRRRQDACKQLRESQAARARSIVHRRQVAFYRGSNNFSGSSSKACIRFAGATASQSGGVPLRSQTRVPSTQKFQTDIRETEAGPEQTTEKRSAIRSRKEFNKVSPLAHAGDRRPRPGGAGRDFRGDRRRIRQRSEFCASTARDSGPPIDRSRQTKVDRGTQRS